ncbi:MAG TPA: hypothetical protein VFY68_11285, partial [Nitrososphaeraceae archaeon]|nr:hypothetical protein [Nitrososphaeraceae archaeon]
MFNFLSKGVYSIYSKAYRKGKNSYFILEPGYQVVLEGEEDSEKLQLVMSVLNETKIVDGVETRVVEEKETEGGNLVEVSRNYFAICNPTNDAIYFGEDVDMYENGNIISHEGAWMASHILSSYFSVTKRENLTANLCVTESIPSPS